MTDKIKLQYITAKEESTDDITQLVQDTISEIYPKYYPKEVVEFFLNLHCRENIRKDILNDKVCMLFANNKLVGTGSYDETHITRVYVSPKFQKQGYGTYIMQRLEDEIAKKYEKAILDASLPASQLYEKRGYKTVEHCKFNVENDVVLVYEVMEKVLKNSDTDIDYEGRAFVPVSNSDNGEVGNQTQILKLESAKVFLKY